MNDLPRPIKEKDLKEPTKGFDDGREPWDWKTRFPIDAKIQINREAKIAACYLALFLIANFVCAGLVEKSYVIPVSNDVVFHLDIKLLAIFFMGGLGGTTFSIKWLMHSVATGKWHTDRFYWRVFVPLIGGVYAVIMLNLSDGGFISAGKMEAPRSMATVSALSFLVGYFSDGVSGLLTNVANAVFGTVEKK